MTASVPPMVADEVREAYLIGVSTSTTPPSPALFGLHMPPAALETVIRQAYQAGWYAAADAEGMVFAKRGEPPPDPAETEDEVVARLTVAVRPAP